MGQNKYSKSQSVTVKRITEDFKNLERRKIIFDKIKLLISPEIQRALMSNQGNNQGGYPPPPVLFICKDESKVTFIGGYPARGMSSKV